MKKIFYYILGCSFFVFLPHLSVNAKNRVCLETDTDTDGDGVPDKKDACPDLAGLKENKGCPEGMKPPEKEFRYDRDKDGIPNDMDKCPDLAGVENEEGCPEKVVAPIQLVLPKETKNIAIAEPTKPQTFEIELHTENNADNPTRDADHDGVKNGVDKCPFTSGSTALSGCPDLSSAEREIIDGIREDVVFDIIQDDLTTRSKEALESLSVMLTVPYPQAYFLFSLKKTTFATNIIKMAKKIIMGVDPGTTITGYALIVCEGKKMKLLTYGIIKLGKLQEASHAQKLKKIYDRVSALVKEYEPDEFAIESPFQGKNIQSMLKLGRAQGVAIAAALAKDIPVSEYAPRKVKMAVTGNGNASKEKVVGMLEHLLDFSYDKEVLDASDAIAIAVCHFFQIQSPLAGAGKAKDWDAFLKNNPHRIIR